MVAKCRWAIISLLLVGCSAAADGTGLVFKELRLDEDAVPLPFVVAVENGTKEAAEIQGVAVNVVSETLITRSEDHKRVPDQFDFEVEFSDDHPTTIESGAEGVACGFLVWKLPPDPPPMIAVVTCDFRVHANNKTLTTEPVTLVLQSRTGLLTGGAANESPLAAKQAKRALDVLANLPGEKSAGFVKIVRQLSAEAASAGE